MDIVFLNGPPGSGKDTAADILVELARSRYTCVEHMKFATPLKQAAHALFGGGESAAYFEETKNEPHPHFLGHTPRQVYIALSEQFVKPTYGIGFFGHALLRQISHMIGFEDSFVVCSDSGFIDELLPVMRALNPERDNVLLIRMHRQGCDFALDSRSHIYPGIESVDIENNGTPVELRIKLQEAMAQWLFKTLPTSTQNLPDAAPDSDLTSLLAATALSEQS